MDSEQSVESRGLPAVARARVRGHIGPLVAQPDLLSESSTSEPASWNCWKCHCASAGSATVTRCQWAGSIRLGTTVTARAPVLRHYELAHLLSNIEKLSLPIWGSMFPFRSFPSVAGYTHT
jgi:hypothetical protein